ncbi:hypothetical protein GCM10011571_03740 [Marinithermofilum abyssi]|uniref:Uncharacterized protein n=1 Tax=Marinithermofilum abyssi TaxID=1571185 RepID=A0A8J2VE64_9BACL|nr:hypothetical protein [Marinithermofilum abyssi]GGE05874.1 hypothetical protein GCM10011571_03740 [Marinithermofilum abyssi]
MRRFFSELIFSFLFSVAGTAAILHHMEQCRVGLNVGLRTIEAFVEYFPILFILMFLSGWLFRFLLRLIPFGGCFSWAGSVMIKLLIAAGTYAYAWWQYQDSPFC